MSRILIRGGRVLDPTSGRDECTDVRIEGGLVAEVGPGLQDALTRGHR